MHACSVHESLPISMSQILANSVDHSTTPDMVILRYRGETVRTGRMPQHACACEPVRHLQFHLMPFRLFLQAARAAPTSRPCKEAYQHVQSKAQQRSEDNLPMHGQDDQKAEVLTLCRESIFQTRTV